MFVRTFLRIGAAALGLALPMSAQALAAPLPGQLSPPNTSITNTIVNTLPVNGTVKLSIPIDLIQIPTAFPTFSLQCSFRYFAGGHGVGTESARIDMPLANRSYSGTLTETLTLQGSTAAMINGYQCDLYLFTAASGGTIPSASNPNPLAQPRPDTPFLTHIEGGF
jgi:hypothetical protein